MRLHHFFIALCIHGATAAVMRKQPAFATPIYSDSYLPASMQVIFHLVDQLKRLEAEELEQNSLLTPSTSPHPPGQKQPLPTVPTNVTGEDIEIVTVSDEEKYYVPPEKYQEEALIVSKPDDDIVSDNISSHNLDDQVTPEVNHEESEVVHGMPETNYELAESNQELPEESYNSGVNLSQLDVTGEGGITSGNHNVQNVPITNCNEFKQLHAKPVDKINEESESTLTVESVVKEIYNIVKNSSSSDFNNNLNPTSADIISNEKCTEAKNTAVKIMAEEDTKEKSDELKDDGRFTLLGEKVDQVPRPSLMAFLRASNSTANPSLQQLGDLYDALSRDARRQGFSKYAGYSDKVLEYLEGSAGGGAGVQLKGLLQKSQQNNELTRYDAMQKTKQIIGVLEDEASKLSTDLRRLLPLRFMH